MKVNLTTPSNLIGQRAERLFNAPLPSGTAPSGVLGSTLSADIAVQMQALELGFVVTGYQYG